MTDPRPLLDETTDELERALLREARDVTASPELRKKTLTALGLGPAPSPTPSKKPWVGGGALKVLGAVLLVGAGIGAYLASRGEAPRPPPPEVARPAPLALPALQPTVLPSASAAPLVESPPATATPVVSARPKSSAPAPRPSAGSSLALETSLIDRARQALYAGDKEAALRALDDYDSRFPEGVFGPEAKKLRARARALP